jgi:hypothetical protein
MSTNTTCPIRCIWIRLFLAFSFSIYRGWRGLCLGGVGGGGHVATRASPVGVHVFTRGAQQLVRVRTEVVSLCLCIKNKFILTVSVPSF